LFEKEKMSPEAIFMTYFLHSVVKNCNRILRSMDTMSDEAKSSSWFNQVKNFLEKRLTQYVSQETNEKFASVHLPSTNPGLDCFCAALMEEYPKSKEMLEESVTRIVGRLTFTQLNINASLQTENKTAVQNFWTNTVKYPKVRQLRKSRNSTVDEEGFQEMYYETSAADKYNLVDDDMEEMLPRSSAGYTRAEVTAWFLEVQRVTDSDMRALSGSNPGTSQSKEKGKGKEGEKKKTKEEEEKEVKIQEVDRRLSDLSSKIADKEAMSVRIQEELKKENLMESVKNTLNTDLSQARLDIDSLNKEYSKLREERAKI
jgi:hypothetical protein